MNKFKTNKLTIKQFNEKYGVDAFQLALDNGFDKDELLTEVIKTGAATYKF